MRDFDYSAFLAKCGDALLKFAGILFVLTTPIHPVIATTLALVIADIITGLWAAHKQGEAWTSRKFKRKIPITVCYVGGLFLMFLVEKYMLDDIPLIKTLAALIAINEGKSIAENFHKITGTDLWKLLIEKLQGSTPGSDGEKSKDK